jgi:hypothetical protein
VSIGRPRGSTEDGVAPDILFLKVSELKAVKNRVHLDIRIGDEDLESVVGGLIDRGARQLYLGHHGRP